MRYPSAMLAYRQASVQQASSVGLVIMLYDALVADLHRATAAMKAGDIEARCRHLKHGFLVLQQLDGLLDMERGGMAAQNLRRFYAHTRKQMLAAQFQLAPDVLERQITYLLEVRGAWEQVDAPAPTNDQAASASDRYGSDQLPSNASSLAANTERSSFSCSV